MGVSRKRRFRLLAIHLRPNPNSSRLSVANVFARLLLGARPIRISAIYKGKLVLP
jgi:hypothetical protein